MTQEELNRKFREFAPGTYYFRKTCPSLFIKIVITQELVLSTGWMPAGKLLNAPLHDIDFTQLWSDLVRGRSPLLPEEVTLLLL